MDAKHRCIQVFGWLSVIAGYGFALLLLRGIFIGDHARIRRPSPSLLDTRRLPAISGSCRLPFRRRATRDIHRERESSTKGAVRMGEMLLGAALIFGAATAQFHPFPDRVKQLQYDNQTQATAGHVTTIAVCIGCVFLILSGIWKGFARRTSKPGAAP